MKYFTVCFLHFRCHTMLRFICQLPKQYDWRLQVSNNTQGYECSFFNFNEKPVAYFWHLFLASFASEKFSGKHENKTYVRTKMLSIVIFMYDTFGYAV